MRGLDGWPIGVVLTLASLMLPRTSSAEDAFDPLVSGVLVTATNPDDIHDPRLGAIAAGITRRGFESSVAGDLARPPPDAERQLIRARFRLDRARRARRKVRPAEAIAAADEAINIFERTASETLHKKLLVDAYVERGAAALAINDAATAETVFLKALALDPLFTPDDVLFPSETIALFADVSRFSRQLRYGSVFVDAVETPGATITVDFGSAQDSPYEVKMPDGHHFVSVRAPGRQEVVARVRVRTERRVEVLIRPPLASAGTAELALIDALDSKSAASVVAAANATRLRFVAFVSPADSHVVVTIHDGRTGAAVTGASTTLSVDPTAREIDAAVDNMLSAMRSHAPEIEFVEAAPWYQTWWGWTIVGTVVAGAAIGTYFAIDGIDTTYRFEP